jgi:hypothetical protein
VLQVSADLNRPTCLSLTDRISGDTFKKSHTTAHHRTANIATVEGACKSLFILSRYRRHFGNSISLFIVKLISCGCHAAIYEVWIWNSPLHRISYWVSNYTPFPLSSRWKGPRCSLDRTLDGPQTRSERGSKDTPDSTHMNRSRVIQSLVQTH